MPSRILYLILFSAILRIVVGASLELSNDEVYYFLYALDLQPNYFDHPPGVGILIRFFTGNLLFTSELFVRLGAIVGAALGTYISFKLGSLLKNERTGWFAAILYNTSIYTSVIAGTFIIPDSPQVIFWLASLWIGYQIILNAHQQQSSSFIHWILFGLLSGLAILCKVHGVFIWFGFGMYILLYKRSLLAKPGLYAAALITALVVSPILIWNIQNDFITYKFHSERVAVRESLIHLDYFIQTVGGQILYNNPVNVVLIFIGLWKVRSLKFMDSIALRFVLWNGLPMILVVTGMSLFNSILPHWSGPGFMVMALLAAAYLDEKSKGSSYSLPLILKSSAYLIVTAFVAAAILINFYPGTLGYRDKPRYGEGDFTLDMYGWKQFADQFSPWLVSQKKSGNLDNNIKIVSHKWFPAAHLDYYVALPHNISLVGVGRVTDLHQYFWLNNDRPTLMKGEDALCVVPSNYSINLDEAFLPYFSSLELLETFENSRSGEVVRYFSVYKLKDYQMTDEMHAAKGK
ncbi:MAG: glycosyltransferase family 39 protein [Cyclobacteriaceae bacterium]|nr:glycosyltransferase family 39 protein [Cyclobacteriaceae bacterium]